MVGYDLDEVEEALENLNELDLHGSLIWKVQN